VSRTVDKLHEAGIKAADYRRLPIGHPRAVFLATILPDTGPGTILIHEGDARIHVSPDRKQTQALVTVSEQPRRLERSVTIVETNRKKLRNKRLVPTQEQIREQVRIETPAGVHWFLVPGRRWEVTRATPTLASIRGAVRANVPASVVNLLMGMDESHNFIAGVPGTPRTVHQAHESLATIPGEDREELRRRAVRQGEWFFMPLDRTTNLLLPRMFDQVFSNFRLEGGWHEVAEAGISHVGQQQMVFARGRVRDRRQGHHENVLLHKWHRVIRNNELRTIPAIGAGPQRTRSWD
jgi:hypothetical protein